MLNKNTNSFIIRVNFLGLHHTFTAWQIMSLLVMNIHYSMNNEALPELVDTSLYLKEQCDWTQQLRHLARRVQ